jgi:hypothetical protein
MHLVSRYTLPADSVQLIVRTIDTVVRDFVPLWNRVLFVSARETNHIAYDR